jgi:predicted neuraminidase
LLARNDAARNHKDGLLLHHVGTPYGGNRQKRQATALENLIDAALTLDFSRA